VTTRLHTNYLTPILSFATHDIYKKNSNIYHKVIVFLIHVLQTRWPQLKVKHRWEIKLTFTLLLLFTCVQLTLFVFFKLFISTFKIQHFNESECIQNVEKEDAWSIAYMVHPPINITLKTFMINLKINRCESLALGIFPQ